MMIVCVLVVYQQMKLVEGINLGYDRDRLSISTWVKFQIRENDYAPGAATKRTWASFVTEARNIPGVASVANFRQQHY